MTRAEVTIVDYGAGNILSVQRGLEHCGAKVTISSDPDIIMASKKIVLPGVGAFPNAMKALTQLKLVMVIQQFAQSERPLLAICLGMQLLMDESEEFEATPGLSLIPGRVIAVPSKSVSGNSQKIPHIGWSALQNSTTRKDWSGTLLENSEEGEAAYFVHSFMSEPSDEGNRVADVMYGGHRISAVISKNQITGCQFHPEKSGEFGLTVLRNFILR
jgi:glutamine amidotransferase